MEAIEFINRYPEYINQIEKVVRPEFAPVIEKLKEHDPHDIVKPEHYFNSDAEAIGVVLKLFLKKLSKVESKAE